MEIFLTSFYFALCCLLISKLSFFKVAYLPPYWLIAVFTIKVIISIIITYIYTNYYTERATADIFKYFDDSKVLYNSIENKPLDFFKLLFGFDVDTSYFKENYYSKMNNWTRTGTSNFISDSHLIIRINMFLRLFSFGFYQVHNVVFNFLAIIGLVAFYKTFQPFVVTKKILFLFICFIPSLLFWGSGLLKESIIIFSLGIFLLHFFKLLDNEMPTNKNITNNLKVKSWLAIVLTILIMLFTKLNVIAALIPSMLGYFIHKKMKVKSLKSYFLSLLIITVFSFVLHTINQKFSPFTMLMNKQLDFINLINATLVESSFEQPRLDSISALLMYVPQALINVFFRPFLWETYSIFTLISALENIALLFIIIFILKYRNNKITNSSVFYFCLLFTFVSALTIGLTTPIMGAIVRYKIFSILFLMIALLMLFDINKFNTSRIYKLFKK